MTVRSLAMIGQARWPKGAMAFAIVEAGSSEQLDLMSLDA
jgi:hypothetical protein